MSPKIKGEIQELELEADDLNIGLEKELATHRMDVHDMDHISAHDDFASLNDAERLFKAVRIALRRNWTTYECN